MSMMPPEPPNIRAQLGQRWDQSVDGKQAPEDVALRDATDDGQACAGCVNFEPPNSCALVAGQIAPTQTCDLFETVENQPMGGPQ